MHRFHIPMAALAAIAFAGATSASSAACTDQVDASAESNIILAQSASPGSQRHPAPPVTQPLQRPGGAAQHSGSGETGSTGSGTSGSGASGDSGSGAGSGGASGDAGAGAGAGGSGGSGAGGGDSGGGGSGGGGGGGSGN